MDTFMLPVLVGLLILVCIAALIIDEYKKEIEKDMSKKVDKKKKKGSKK